MRAVILRDPKQMMNLLKTPHATQRLATLLKVAPNCLSAKYLLMYLQGTSPRRLSIGGSIEAAQGSSQSIVAAIDHDVGSEINKLKGDELGTSLFKLRRLRPHVDPRVWPYVDALVAFGEVIRGTVLNPIRSNARLAEVSQRAKAAAFAVKSAFEKLMSDPAVREEIER